MSPDPAIAHFVATSAAEVRRMTLTAARLYLQGLLIVAGQDEAVEPLREIYRNLDAATAQLELMLTPQPRPAP